jgi:hypothetical protein
MMTQYPCQGQVRFVEGTFAQHARFTARLGEGGGLFVDTGSTWIHAGVEETLWR